MSEEKPVPKAVNEQLPLTENLQARKIEAEVPSGSLPVGTDEGATPTVVGPGSSPRPPVVPPIPAPATPYADLSNAGPATDSGPATPLQPTTAMFVKEIKVSDIKEADGSAAGKATVQGVGEAVRAKARERPVDEMLNDPLREVTRKERRSLLGISAIALLVGWTQGRIVPSKIENIGINDLTAPDRSVLLGLFFWIVVYYFVAFVVYAATDFLKYFHTMREGAKTLSKQRDEQVTGSLKVAVETPWWLRFVVPASLVRGVFDFLITLVIAGIAMWSLWGAVHQVATTARPQPPPAPSAPAPPTVAPAVPPVIEPSRKTAPVPAKP